MPAKKPVDKPFYGRVAGDLPYYTWVLHNADGTPTDYSRNLVSVTTVTKLLDHVPPAWGAKITRDAVLKAKTDGLTEAQLKTLLKDMGATTDAIKNRSAGLGSYVHELCERWFKNDPPTDDEISKAQVMIDKGTKKSGRPPAYETMDLSGYWAAFQKWLREQQPAVLAAERVVSSFIHGFAGTLDLAWTPTVPKGADPPVVLTDWKTGTAIRTSAFAQVEGLKIAWLEESPWSQVHAQVVRFDAEGEYETKWSPFDGQVFLNLLDVWRSLDRTGLF